MACLFCSSLRVSYRCTKVTQPGTWIFDVPFYFSRLTTWWKYIENCRPLLPVNSTSVYWNVCSKQFFLPHRPQQMHGLAYNYIVCVFAYQQPAILYIDRDLNVNTIVAIFLQWQERFCVVATHPFDYTRSVSFLPFRTVKTLVSDPHPSSKYTTLRNVCGAVRRSKDSQFLRMLPLGLHNIY